jgi:signal transduction histidine kinase
MRVIDSHLSFHPGKPYNSFSSAKIVTLPRMGISFMMPYELGDEAQHFAGRQRDFLRVLSLFGVVSLLIYAAYHLFFLHERLPAAVEGVIGMLTLLNLVFMTGRRAKGAATVFAFLMLCLLLFLFWSGGANGTGIFWFYTYPISIFLLLGLRKGTFWMCALFIGIVVLTALASFGKIPLFYAFETVFGMLPSLLVVTLISFVKERTRAIDERSIEEKGMTLSTILDYIPLGVMLVRVPDGTPILANAMATHLLGRGVDAGSRRNRYQETYAVTREDGSPYPNDEMPVAITLRTGNPAVKSDIFINQPSGERIVLRAASVPIADKNKKMFGAAVVFQDFREEYEVDKSKSEFVSVVSRMLQEPVTSIRWHGESLLDGDLGPLQDQQRTYIQRILESDQRLIVLANDLLDAMRIDSGKEFAIAPEPTDMIAILDRIIKELLPLAEQRSITFKKGDAVPKKLVRNVDAQKIARVFRNLLSNAAQYSQIGGVVEIGFEDRAKEAMFSITDHGVGIPEDAKANVFRKFFRAPNVLAKGIEGTGLGLYIAKAIVELHNGSIWFESKENLGTTFCFTVPE